VLDFVNRTKINRKATSPSNLESKILEELIDFISNPTVLVATQNQLFFADPFIDHMTGALAAWKIATRHRRWLLLMRFKILRG
jgi:hypothetical protein